MYKRIMWIMLLVGAIFLYLGISDQIKNSKTPLDFNTMEVGDFKKGQIVEGDIQFNMGSYMETYNTRYGIKVGDEKLTYLIITSDGGYISYYSAISSDETELNRQADETDKFLAGQATEEPKTIHFKGEVQKMSKKELSLLEEAMEAADYDKTEFEDWTAPYKIVKKNYSSAPIMILIGGVVFVLGVVLLVAPIIVRKKNAM